MGDDGQATGGSIITISGVARGAGANAAAFIKRGSGTGSSTGGASQSGSSSKRTASAAVNSAAAAVSSISFRRVPSSATAATGSQSTATAPKRVLHAGVLSGAGFLIGLGAKVTGATALTGRIAGAGFVIGTGVRRVLSTATVRSAGASAQSSTKRASSSGLSQGASRVSSLSSRFSNAAASIRGAASTATQSIKRIGATGKIAGGSSVLIGFLPPPLPDIVNIAGRWLVSAGFTGVVPGDVTVDAISAPVLIKGTRTQA